MVDVPVRLVELVTKPELLVDDAPALVDSAVTVPDRIVVPPVAAALPNGKLASVDVVVVVTPALPLAVALALAVVVVAELTKLICPLLAVETLPVPAPRVRLPADARTLPPELTAWIW